MIQFSSIFVLAIYSGTSGICAFAAWPVGVRHCARCPRAALQRNFRVRSGHSFFFDIGQGLDQVASLINSIAGISYSYSFALAGGTLPPGLTLSPSGLISGTLTTAGQFSFTLNFSETLSEDGQTVFDESVPIPSRLDVTGYSGPAVTIDPARG